MNLKFTCVLLFLMILAGTASAQVGSIKGNIKTSDGYAAEHVNISLKGTSKGASANKKGDYEIRNIAPGNYTVVASFVGLQSVEQNIAVVANQTTTVPAMVLLENSTQLSEVVVSEFKEKQYAETTPTNFARLDVPLLENPQTIQVLSEEVIKDQRIFTMMDAIKNIAGVSQYNGGQYNDFNMRGFRSSTGNLAYNGQRGSMNDNYSPQNLFNVERIEAIKGPASIYFGAANPGGIINVVTKKPQEKSSYGVDYTIGSWNTHRVIADATGKITKDKKLLYRAIVGYQDNKSFRDFIGARTLFIAPSLTYKPTEHTSINVEYNFMRRTETGGGYYERGIITTDPNNLFQLPISWTQHEPTDRAHEYSNSLQLNVTHKFNEHVSITSINRVSAVNAGQNYHHLNWGSIYNADGVNDTITRHYREYHWYIRSFMSSTFVNVKVKTGAIAHSLVAGMDIGNYRYGFTEAAPHYNARYNGIAPLNIFNPAYGQSNPDNYTGFEYYGGRNTNEHYTGFYVQDFIELSPKMKAILGLRYDRFNNPTRYESVYYENEGDYVFNPANVYEDNSSADAFIPRFGLVYLPVQNISVYGSYIQSFLPQYSNMPNAGGPFPPERGEQFEFGAKGEFFSKRFIPSLAIYHIENKNVLTPDPADPNKQLVNGLARSRGVELSAQGEIVPGLNVTGSYSYNEAKTIKDANGEAGKLWFDNAPNHMANLWTVYTIQSGVLKGLKFGGGFNYVGERCISSDPDVRFPSYTLFDAMAGYTYKNYSIGLNFNNITDEKYITGGWSREMMLPGAPSNVKASVAVRF